MGKRISIGIVTALSLFALLSLFISGAVVRAQTEANSTLPDSVTITAFVISSGTTLNTTMASTTSYLLTSTSGLTSLGTTTNSVSSTSYITVADTSTVSLNATTTSTVTEDSSTMNHSVTVTVTSTTTAATTTDSSAAYDSAYSISFSPSYWFCSDVSVTFTGPLVESGLYGDTLQFQYFQYNPTFPSVLIPIFTDSDLTVTSDTVNYWISYGEYAQVNFAYQPNIAVKVVDLTPKSNGYAPGLIFMDLTNITPEGLQYCSYPNPMPAPEFQVQWLVIVASIVLSLAVLRIRKQH